MQTIFLVPGIEGSRLSLGTEEVWPPTAEEVITGYKRIDKLLNPSTVATAIFDKLLISAPLKLYYPVYQPLMDKLDQTALALGAKRINFFYDWRTDLWSSTPPFTSSAEKLAKAIESSVAAGTSSVTLVCHSMGCLVARLVVESPKYKSAAWYPKIRRLVCICGPNHGAPIAVGRALGCEGPSLGLSADDLKRIENDPRYPAGFQCFTEPGMDVLYDVSSGAAVSVDIYGASPDKTYQLTHSNALAAATSWNQLNIDGHPKSIDYVMIGAQGNRTSKAYLFNGTRYVQTINEDEDNNVPLGDGTVPLWSSVTGKFVTRYTVFGEHVGVLGTPQLKQILDKIFGIPAVSMLVRGKPGVTVQVNKNTFVPDEMMNVLVLPDTPTNEIDGRLILVSIAASPSQPTSELVPYGTGSQLTYKGPEISHIASRLPAPRVPGAYVLKFEGTHDSTESTSAMFFVNAKSTVSIHSGERTGEEEASPPRSRKSKPSKSKKKR